MSHKLLARYFLQVSFLGVVVIVLSQHFLINWLGAPQKVRHLDDLFLLSLGGFALLRALARGKIYITVVDVCLGIYLSLALLSGVINEVPLENLLLGVRAAMPFVAVFYIIRFMEAEFTDLFMKKMMTLLMTMAFLQIVVGGLFFLNRTSSGEDWFMGTIYDANLVGFFLLGALFYYLTELVEGSGGKGRLIAIILLLMGSIVLASAKAAIILFFPLFFLLWGKRFFRIKTLLKYALVFVLIFLASDSIYKKIFTRSILYDVGLHSIVYNLTSIRSGGGSLLYYPVVYDLVNEESPIPLLGLGPGMVSSNAAVQLKSPYYEKYLYNFFDQKRFGLDPLVNSQIVATAGETGPIAFLLLFGVHLIFLKSTLKVFRESDSLFLKKTAAATATFIVVALATSLYTNIWEFASNGFFVWLLGGYLYRKARIEKNVQTAL